MPNLINGDLFYIFTPDIEQVAYSRKPSMSDSLLIEPTDSTPYVSFSPNGEIRIEGKALPEDSKKFFRPLFDWVEINLSEAEKIRVDMKLEYFNTSASKQIYELLVMLKQKAENKDIEVNWFYEEGDSEVLETGEHYESLIEIPFNFIEYSESL